MTVKHTVMERSLLSKAPGVGIERDANYFVLANQRIFG